MVTGYPLSIERICERMEDALRSSPNTLSTINHAYAVFIHACMICTGFNFIGIGTDCEGKGDWVADRRFTGTGLRTLYLPGEQC